jgi:hypothetical protein
MRSPSVRRTCLAALAVAVGVLLAGTSAASATLVHPFAASFGAFSNPQALAVDQSTGDVYVIDVGTATVQKFDATGSPVNFSALGSNTLDGAGGADATPEGGFSFDFNSAAELAIDNSGGPADGFLYVTNSLAGVIDVFDATGTFAGEIDGSAATPQSGGETCGVGTDPSGHVYVSSFSGHVDKYTPTDANPAHDTFNGQLENVGGVCHVAADGLGSVYVSTWPTGPLTKYDQAQLDQGAPSGTDVDDTTLAVAVDPSNDDVYVDHGNGIAQYDASGTPIGRSGASPLAGDSFGVAIRGSSGLLYASDSDHATVQRFDPAIVVSPPAVTIDQPSNVTTSHATFSGTVNPSGTDPLNDTSWHFEYSTDGGATFASTPGGHIGTGTSAVAVSDDVSSFIPNQAVQVRLVATNGAGSTTSSTVSFTTPAIGPDATTLQAQDVAPTRAALTGLVAPHHSQTRYFFEYGPTTAYGTSVPATQDADAGSGNAIVGVAQRVAGLTPGSTYHFRLVAVNQVATSSGADQTFTTTVAPAASPARAGIAGSGFLPDGRAWEKASPGDKNGGDVMGVSTRTRVASDGDAVGFASLAGFGDAIGTSVGTDYMSIRGAGGWATHAITPPQRPLPVGVNAHGVQSVYDGPFSPDLSTGMFSAWSPLTNDPNVAGVPNLYLRRDLRTAGAGTYALLSPCPLCDASSTPLPAPVDNAGGQGRPYVAGASADFGHVIFESQEPRTAEALSGCNNQLFDAGQCPFNLYEWDHGTLRFVAFLPDDECSGAPPCTARFSEAGQGAANPVYTPHTISADGSRIFFTVTDGPFTQIGNLYMRVDHATTVRINAPEPGSPPDGSAPAAYWDATPDGSRVFFTTAQALTDDAPVGGTQKLYMYDTSRPDSDPHNLTLISRADTPSLAGGVQSVVGVGGDGHYVYFLATGAFVAGQPAADRAIYAWHDGSVRFVAPVASDDDSEDTTVRNWSLNPAVSRVTPDGRHLLFGSRAAGTGPTGYDQTCDANGGRCRQLYVYDYDSQRLACASCNPTGARATGDAFTTADANRGDATFTFLQNASLSDDGRRVFFSSPDPLVPEDRNDRIDAYEYDAATGTEHLLSSGRDPSDSVFLDASPSGNDAFFVTRQQLTGTDVDNSYDLYDARVGGGFPEPPPTPPACAGEACRAPQSATPAASAPGTGAITGDGNLPSKPKAKPKPKPKRCRKGFVRKRVHGRTTCVKARKKPRHAAKRAQHGAQAKRGKATPRRSK